MYLYSPLQILWVGSLCEAAIYAGMPVASAMDRRQATNFLPCHGPVVINLHYSRRRGWTGKYLGRVSDSALVYHTQQAPRPSYCLVQRA